MAKVYCQTEKEGLGIVWACEKFQLYLIGTKFDLLTDHKPLERMFCPRHKVSARIERWTLRLQPFMFTIKHIPGKGNPTDILSRMPLQQLIDKSRLRTEEYINQIIRQLVFSREIIAEGKGVPDAYKRVKDELTVANGVLLRQSIIAIPKELRKRCLELVHKYHMGIVRCKEHLRSKVWWPAIDKEVENYIQNCKACQLVGKNSKPEPLIVSTLLDRPWQEIYSDICGPFPNGDSLFTMMDGYSRFPEVVIVKSTTGGTFIRFMDKIFSRLGFPEKFVSDNGSNFRSEEMKAYLKSCGIKQRKVIPYSPQSNGLIERFNRTLKKMIQTVHSEGRVWQDALYSFLLDYRSTPHASTNKTPALLMFGKEIRIKIPAFNSKLEDQEIREKDWKSKQTMKKYFDENNKAQQSSLKVGDIVFLRQKKTNKLSTRYKNQKYEILQKKGNSVTITSEEGEVKIRNSREVKLFQEAKKEEKESNVNERKTDESSKKEDIYPPRIAKLEDIGVEQAEEEAEVQQQDEHLEVEQASAGKQRVRPLRARHRPLHLRDFVLD